MKSIGRMTICVRYTPHPSLHGAVRHSAAFRRNMPHDEETAVSRNRARGQICRCRVEQHVVRSVQMKKKKKDKKEKKEKKKKKNKNKKKNKKKNKNKNKNNNNNKPQDKIYIWLHRRP